MCEAARVPVIWATQVLENLAKTGAPSRAEITDAAFPETAERQVKSHLASAIWQDQGKRLMFEPPSGLDVTRNWALTFSPGIVIVATTWWL